MAIDRNIDPSSYETGTGLATDIAETLNYVGGLFLGRLNNVDGTNTITADVAEDEGFSALTDGALAILVPAADNTDAVTLKIGSGTENPVYNNKKEALAESDLKSGRAVPIQYNADDSGWRVLVDVPSQAVITAQADVPPYSNLSEITATSTWTAPYDCFVRIWLFGGGASGGRDSGRRGGGGGATSIKDRFFMTSGQQLSLTIGGGGAGGTDSDGHDGGGTYCTGPNSLDMVAGGGKKGSASGGTGGVASGGDINWNGQSVTSTAGGKSGLRLKLTSRIITIGPFTSASLLPDGTDSKTTGSTDSANPGFAVVEYTTAIT